MLKKSCNKVCRGNWEWSQFATYLQVICALWSRWSFVSYQVGSEGLALAVPESINEDLIVLYSYGAHNCTQIKSSSLEHHTILIIDAGALRKDEKRGCVWSLDMLSHSLGYYSSVFDLHTTFSFYWWLNWYSDTCRSYKKSCFHFLPITCVFANRVSCLSGYKPSSRLWKLQTNHIWAYARHGEQVGCGTFLLEICCKGFKSSPLCDWTIGTPGTAGLGAVWIGSIQHEAA